MTSIPNEFEDTELLLRAIFPPNRRPDFWTGTRITSAALKTNRGLSVDRTYHRPIEEAVEFMKPRFIGYIVSISVGACRYVQAKPVYLPTPDNEYHSEIRSSKYEKMLSDEQALYLARAAKIVYNPTIDFVS